MEYYREIKKLSHDNMDESNKTRKQKKKKKKSDKNIYKWNCSVYSIKIDKANKLVIITLNSGCPWGAEK